MKILNIGFPEIFFLLVIMLIFLGPKGMQENSKKLARFIRKIIRSDTWKTFSGLYRDIKEYPSELMKEAKLDELRDEINHEVSDIQKSVDNEIKQANDSINNPVTTPENGDSKEEKKSDDSDR